MYKEPNVFSEICCIYPKMQLAGISSNDKITVFLLNFWLIIIITLFAHKSGSILENVIGSNEEGSTKKLENLLNLFLGYLGF